LNIIYEAVIAMDKCGAIGAGGKLPWHLPSDLMHFKKLTMGFPILMGRKTFASLPGVLPGRPHIIFSHTEITSEKQGVYFCKSITQVQALALKNGWGKIFVCGGATIYDFFKEHISLWHVSKIDLRVEQADTYFTLPHFLQKKSSQLYEDQSVSIQWRYEQWEKTTTVKDDDK
jgi:dihydrofolate reductase